MMVRISTIIFLLINLELYEIGLTSSVINGPNFNNLSFKEGLSFSTNTSFKRYIRSISDDKKKQCMNLKLDSLKAETGGNIAKPATGLFSFIPIIGSIISAVAGTASDAIKYGLKYKADSAYVKLGCDNIPFEELTEKMEDRFSDMKATLETNFGEVKTSMEYGFKQVDSGLDRNLYYMQYGFSKLDSAVYSNYVALKSVSEMLNNTYSLVEESRIEMRQGFSIVMNTMRNSKIEEVITRINDFIVYFESEKNSMKYLDKDKYVTKLEDEDGLLSYLKAARTGDGHSLNSLLTSLINDRYTEDGDQVSVSALYSLFYGTQTYVSVMFFLMEQYSYLADYYYVNRNVHKYNKYMDQIKINFNDFKYSFENASLLDNVVTVMSTFQLNDSNFSLPEGQKKFISDLSSSTRLLKNVKNQISSMTLPLFADKPAKMTGRPSLAKSTIFTPLGKWKEGAKVKYAVQFRKNGTYSKIGDWSNALIITNKAHPIIRVPVDEKRRERIIFRQFDDDLPELVGVLEDKYQTNFRDINRDLYTTASWSNEEKAMSVIKILLDNGADIFAQFDNGRSAIHSAALAGNTQVVEKFILLSNASDVNVQDHDGYTPLHISADSGTDDFVQLLINHNADVNAKTYFKFLTALHMAASKGFTSTVQLLLESNKVDVNSKDVDGFTPLHSAVFGGVDCIQALTSHPNIDVNSKGASGLTALHLAAINGFVDVCAALLETSTIDINSKADGNLTALHFATIAGNLEVVKLLTGNERIDANVQAYNNWTALMFAVSLQMTDISQELINISDLDIAGAGNVTPLHMAVITGQADIVKSLVDKRAQVNIPTVDGFTPIHLAVVYNNLNLVTYLADKCSDLNYKNREKRSPFLSAVEFGYDKIARFLADREDVNINAKDSEDRTGLVIAVSKGYNDTAIYLSSIEAINVNIKDKNNQTALIVAAGKGNLTVVKSLLERDDIKIDAVDGNGRNAFEEAVNENYQDIADCLLNSKSFGNHEVKNGSIEYEPLEDAISSKTLALLKHLMSKGNNIYELQYSSITKRLSYYIHTAAWIGSLEIFKFLVEEANFNMNTRDEEQRTPLHYASESGNIDVVRYIMSKNDSSYYLKDSLGKNALHYAAQAGQLGVVKYLVEEENVDSSERLINGDGALHLAVRGDHLNVVKYLIENQHVAADTMGNLYRTGLHNAAYSGHTIMVQYLVDVGNADTTARDRMLYTPLNLAAISGQLDIVKYLIDVKQVDMNIRGEDNRTPLLDAAAGGKLDVMKYLLDEKYVDIDERDRDNNTPLLLAAVWGHTNVVKYLLEEKKVAYYPINNDGDTPLTNAAWKNRLDVIKYLIDIQHVDINQKGTQRKTALHYACKYGYLDTVKYLVAHEGIELNPRCDEDNNATPLGLAIAKGQHSVVDYLSRIPGTIAYIVTTDLSDIY